MTELADRPSARAIPPWVTNLVIVAAIAALWPLSGFLRDQVNPYVVMILILIGINIILATSLNLINGITGQFSLGHAGFMGVGAYTTAVLVNYLADHGQLAGREWAALLLFLPVGGVIAAAMGLTARSCHALVTTVYRKLAVRGRVELMATWMRGGR